MYFLNEEEKMYLHQSLIPDSREMYIDYSLRGWNWHQPPLEPVYDLTLGVAEIANNYCSTDRDLYLKRVMKEYFKPNQKMKEGLILHQTITEFITTAKKRMYNISMTEINDSGILKLDNRTRDSIKEINCSMSAKNWESAKEKVENLWDFEEQRVKFRVQEVLAAQPYIGIDALMYQVLPVVVEQKLNGTFLGLSPYLSTDALNFSEPMIVDIKFGEKKDFHKLSVTGYSLVMESLFSFPINIGCIVYPSFKDNRVLVERDLFIITDELRQKFIERRDDKMRMIYEDIDPGISDNCYKSCPFYDNCR